MRRATLTRTETSDVGTFGRLVLDSGLVCFTGELPWRDNAPDRSCIPPGRYQCTWRFSSARHVMCYHVDGVPGRAGVEIHAANYVGDARMGYLCQLKGCIAPGTSVGPLPSPAGQRAVLHSGQALRALEHELAHEPFELTVIGP